jgi:hypothetical protein
MARRVRRTHGRGPWCGGLARIARVRFARLFTAARRKSWSGERGGKNNGHTKGDYRLHCRPLSLIPMGDNGRSPEGIPQLTGIRAEGFCRCPIEKSQILPDRNVAAHGGRVLSETAPLPPGGARAARSRAEAGVPVRAAQPLRPSLATSIIETPCDQPEAVR